MASYNQTVSWTGASGRIYNFRAYTIDQECPDEGGIYIFARRQVNRVGALEYATIYIGKAQSFQQGFYSHHKGDCIDRQNADAICWLMISTDRERTVIEKDLLAAHRTPCNEVNN